MSTPDSRPTTGRTVGHRPNVKAGYCASCSERILVGEPNPDSEWASPMHSEKATERLADLILLAAAEYRHLSEEAGVPMDAVAFADWLRPELLGRHTAPLTDGRRMRDGSSEPFPLPYAGFRSGDAA